MLKGSFEGLTLESHHNLLPKIGGLPSVFSLGQALFLIPRHVMEL